MSIRGIDMQISTGLTGPGKTGFHSIKVIKQYRLYHTASIFLCDSTVPIYFQIDRLNVIALIS